MSDIPVISITQECSDDELEDVAKLDINEAHTDTEDLIMEHDQVRFRKSPKPTGNTMVDAIQPTINGSVTDVEDCTDSEGDEEEVKSTKESDITLDSFLDQGYVDETTKSSNKGDKPKTLTRCSSKATESDTLQVTVDESGALTDCEDCALSEDDDSLGKVSIPDCPEDILMKGNDNDAVNIHNVVKRKQEKHFHKQEAAADDTSSDSDNDSRVRHRKFHRKTDDRPKSDCENFSLSDEEMSGACARPTNRRSVLFDAEELVMEGSDMEEDKPNMFPEINITFVSDEQDTHGDRVTKSRPSTLAVQGPNPDEALTDVENLDSSGSEEERECTGKRLMPRAVVRSGKAGGGGTTDVEDFNDSDDNDEQEQKREVPQEFLPSPVREIAIVKHDETGEQRQNVMPLNQGMLTVRTPDVEQALTDVEDVSDAEEAEELYDSSKYDIGSLPEVENGDIYSNDNPRAKSAKLEVKCPAQEPVTDTEDLFFERSASNSGTGSELRRRRKTKHFTSPNGYACQQLRGKKHLEMKVETAAATTDVEDMYLSDDTKDCEFERTKQQRRATIQVSSLATTNDCEGKTDVEFLSGDELVNERSVHSPQLYHDGFSSVIKARERNGPIKPGTKEAHPIPMIRKISPSPDAHNCHTDCEEMQVASDGDDPGAGLDDSYSRAQTATPFELTRALDESGRCVIHETSPRLKSELLDVKGTTGGDQPEIHTDVEFLDDDVGNAADQ